jgi:hypothetical protein
MDALSIRFNSPLLPCTSFVFRWNKNACEAADGTAPGEEGDAIGTGLWYKSADEKCSKDCKVGGTDCGGVAASWDPKYKTRKECCAERVWWSKECDE